MCSGRAHTMTCFDPTKVDDEQTHSKGGPLVRHFYLAWGTLSVAATFKFKSNTKSITGLSMYVASTAGLGRMLILAFKASSQPYSIAYTIHTQSYTICNCSRMWIYVQMALQNYVSPLKAHLSISCGPSFANTLLFFMFTAESGTQD